ncbi:MAG: ParB/RepB/Spo0J family partition protein [Burkholderiaceae bacterium]|nr:MAG: ParB/RepB/Spo0J family partition protein [Burkholderiaceae bacterium]
MSTNKRPKGLGRGLEALLGSETTISTPEGAPHSLPLSLLQAGKYQPRTRMDEASLNELAASIRAQGLMQPIVVRPVDGNRYEIIAGERRFRASGIAGLSEVPVVVKNVPDEAALAMALIENIQREDLNPLEEAQGIQRLINEFGMTHEDAAGAVGRSRSATSNLLRLLNLAKPVQTMLMAGDVDMGHARALLAVDAVTQIQLANQIHQKRLSVRETEALVTRTLASASEATGSKRKGHEKGRDTQRLEEKLADHLGLHVEVKTNAKGRGQLVVHFSSNEELEGLLAKMKYSES